MGDSKPPEPAFEIATRVPNVGLPVDFGRLRRKQIERLKRGESLLTARIQAAVDRQRQELGIDAAAEIVPVVLLYRQSEPDYVVITAKAVREDR